MLIQLLKYIYILLRLFMLNFVKIEQQQKGNQMIYILVYFKMLYYIDFNYNEQDNNRFWINIKFCIYDLCKKNF